MEPFIKSTFFDVLERLKIGDISVAQAREVVEGLFPKTYQDRAGKPFRYSIQVAL